MIGNLMKFVTTFIQITSTDSEIIIIKNRGKANLFCVLVCAIVSDCNKDISQTRAGFAMVPVANERYISLVSTTIISEFLDVPFHRYVSNITGCSRKTARQQQNIPTQLSIR